MQRIGQVIGIDPAQIDEYKRLHAAVWPEVLARITACNIRNYSIFLRQPENLMFAYFEYHGTDFAADMAAMAADPATQEWWKLCMPMQRPLDSRSARRLVGADGTGLSPRLMLPNRPTTIRSRPMPDRIANHQSHTRPDQP